MIILNFLGSCFDAIIIGTENYIIFEWKALNVINNWWILSIFGSAISIFVHIFCQHFRLPFAFVEWCRLLVLVPKKLNKLFTLFLRCISQTGFLLFSFNAFGFSELSFAHQTFILFHQTNGSRILIAFCVNGCASWRGTLAYFFGAFFKDGLWFLWAVFMGIWLLWWGSNLIALVGFVFRDFPVNKNTIVS